MYQHQRHIIVRYFQQVKSGKASVKLDCRKYEVRDTQ